jgi:hypothetical protein
MNAKLRVAAISLALIVIAGLVLLLVRPEPRSGAGTAAAAADRRVDGVHRRRLAAAEGAAAVRGRLILLGGIAVQLAAVSAPPQNSNDLYRYIWDGRVQAAGVDPYAYVPTARQLTGLRDEFLFHPGAEYCVSQSYVVKRIRPPNSPRAARDQPADGSDHLPAGGRGVLPRRALPARGQQLGHAHPGTTALVAVLVTVLLLFGCGRLGRDVRTAALWSWCPMVALEAGNSAHVDVVAPGSPRPRCWCWPPRAPPAGPRWAGSCSAWPSRPR